MLSKDVRWIRRPTPYDRAVLILLGAICLSLVSSSYLSRSLRASPPLLIGLGMLFLVAKGPSTARPLGYLWWGLIGFGFLLGLLVPPAMLPPHHRLFRSFPWWFALRPLVPESFNGNVIAGVVVMVLPFGLAGTLAPALPGRWPVAQRLLALLCTAMMVFLLPLTESRAGLLAALAGALMLLALRWPRPILYGLFPLLALLLTWSILEGWPLTVRSALQGAAVRTLGQRMEIWSRAILLMAHFPITGAGLDSFQPLLASRYPLYTVAHPSVTHAHNLYLQVGVELGLPGLIAYLATQALGCYASIAAYAAFRRAGAWYLATASAACVASLLGMYAQGLVDAATWGNKGAFLPWVVLGLGTAFYRLSRSPGVSLR